MTECLFPNIKVSPYRIRSKDPYYIKKYRDDFYKSNKERYAAERYRLKIETIRHYSDNTMQCVCCGESEPKFLTIDHISGGGNEHRRKLFNSPWKAGNPFYFWLKKNGYPKGYRVLCMNCNLAYGLYGNCPHQEGLGVR